MKTFRKLLFPLVLSVMASACGGSDKDDDTGDGSGAKLGGGKQGAAKALHQANRPVRGESSGFGQGLVAMALPDVSSERTEPGAAGGKALVKETVNVAATGDIRVESVIQYVDYSEDGKNRFNGTMTDTVVVSASSGTGEVLLTSKGRVQITGEVTDFLDANATLKVGGAEISATTGEVSMNIRGTLTTSSGVHTYADEAISIVADGTLPVAP
ncbi:hypothetical protein [Pyxidicoccus xibeiensis]|uniref:hypothetical protein n=1 Tax=Pyxidicoccus xibeiensis TaxID=2906759 RepID=UPI0020A7EAB6|nr:hypothetical protein [Pyxidicoccus xibeiensis]MCP3139458.1 hypothetical protein [Pyxidicoccus xibeiensis]